MYGVGTIKSYMFLDVSYDVKYTVHKLKALEIITFNHKIN